MDQQNSVSFFLLSHSFFFHLWLKKIFLDIFLNLRVFRLFSVEKMCFTQFSGNSIDFFGVRVLVSHFTSIQIPRVIIETIMTPCVPIRNVCSSGTNRFDRLSKGRWKFIPRPGDLCLSVYVFKKCCWWSVWLLVGFLVGKPALYTGRNFSETTTYSFGFLFKCSSKVELQEFCESYRKNTHIWTKAIKFF